MPNLSRTAAIAAIICLFTLGKVQAAVVVSGQVFEQGTRAGVGRAKLALYSTIGTANPNTPVASAEAFVNGTYVLKAPAAGNFLLEVIAARYVEIVRPLHVPAAGLPALDLMLVKVPSLRVRLKDPAGAPILKGQVEARIWMLWGDHKCDVAAASADVAPDGVATLLLPQDIPTAAIDKALVEIRHDPDGWAQVSLDHWPDNPVDLALQPGGSIAGVVLDAVGKPDAGYLAFCSLLLPDGFTLRNDSTYIPEIRTDDAGHFTFDALPAGKYLVMASDAKGAVYSRTVTVNADKTEVTLSTADAVSAHADPQYPSTEIPYSEVVQRVQPDKFKTFLPVDGKVFDSVTHAPKQGVTVILWSQMSNLYGDEYSSGPASAARTGPDGSFHLQAYVDGEYRLVAQATEYGYVSPPNQTVEITPAGLSVDVLLIPLPMLRLKVSGSDGKPLTRGLVSTNLWLLWGKQNGTEESDTRPVAPDGTVTLVGPPRFKPGDLTKMVLDVREKSAGVAEVRLDHWPDGPIDVALKPGETLTGTITVPPGKPVDSILSVAAMPILSGGWPSSFESFEAQTDKTDVYKIPALLPGKYLVRAYIRDVGALARTAEAPSAGPVNIGPNDLLVESQDTNRRYGQMSYSTLVERVDPDRAQKLIPVAGRVVDKRTQVPITGVSLVVNSQQIGSEDAYGGPLSVAQTGPDGAFTLKVPAAGQYHVMVNPQEDHIQTELNLDIPTTGTANQQVFLATRPVLRLRLWDAEGKPVSAPLAMTEAKVYSQQGTLESGAAGEASPDGIVKFPFFNEFPTDKVANVNIAMRDPVAGCLREALTGWPVGAVSVHLQHGATLRGSVLDAARKGIPQVPYSLSWISSQGLPQGVDVQTLVTGTTDDDGHFEIPALWNGAYVLTANVPGEKGRGRIVTVDAAAKMDVILKPGDRL